MRQKTIIQNILAKEVNQGNYAGLRSSKKCPLPTMQGKQKIVKKSHLRMMNIINTKWWNEWCDYTSFNAASNSIERTSEERDRARRSGSAQTAYN